MDEWSLGKEGWNETGNERLSPVSLPVTSSVWSWVLWALPLDAHTPPHTCQDIHTHTKSKSHRFRAPYFIPWHRETHRTCVFVSVCSLSRLLPVNLSHILSQADIPKKPIQKEREGKLITDWVFFVVVFLPIIGCLTLFRKVSVFSLSSTKNVFFF